MYGGDPITQSLMAIKWLTNVSAHQSRVSLKRLFDAYNILEQLLAQLFPPDERHLDQLPEEIVKTKGRML